LPYASHVQSRGAGNKNVPTVPLTGWVANCSWATCAGLMVTTAEVGRPAPG
jgi:hypothetical protein